jgi:hypothetical protein
LHELHDQEHPDQNEDKEDSKVNPLRKEHEDRNDSKPQREGNNRDLLFSHQDSSWRDTFIVPEFMMLRPEPERHGGREYLLFATCPKELWQ